MKNKREYCFRQYSLFILGTYKSAVFLYSWCVIRPRGWIVIVSLIGLRHANYFIDWFDMAVNQSMTSLDDTTSISLPKVHCFSTSSPCYLILRNKAENKYYCLVKSLKISWIREMPCRGKPRADVKKANWVKRQVESRNSVTVAPKQQEGWPWSSEEHFPGRKYHWVRYRHGWNGEAWRYTGNSLWWFFFKNLQLSWSGRPCGKANSRQNHEPSIYSSCPSVKRQQFDLEAHCILMKKGA